MRMRFWIGITRGDEKWVKLALGHFFGCGTDRAHAPSNPKPGRTAQSPHLSVFSAFESTRAAKGLLERHAVQLKLGVIQFIELREMPPALTAVFPSTADARPKVFDLRSVTVATLAQHRNADYKDKCQENATAQCQENPWNV